MKHAINIQGLEESKYNPKHFGGMCSRSIKIAGSDFDNGIDTIATTEDPALVMDWDRWEIIREILPMKFYEKPDNDKTPLLDSHARYSIDDIKGSATNWSTSGKQLLCKTFISSSEEITRQKIKEKHIENVSLGYQTDPERTIEIPKKATVVVDGLAYENNFQDNYPMVIRLWWQPKELSMVPLGADSKAKFKSLADRKSVV